jgi:hypothetical protein
MYFFSGKKLETILKKLKSEFNLSGIKAEFEAEGSSVADIVRLRNLTLNNNVKLFVKIGGVEALNDIYECIDAGVDGIIAPMVETKFALKKFLDSINSLKIQNRPDLTINIETKTGVENFDDILSHAIGNIENITIGRSDLSSSYYSRKITQNSNQILNTILKIGKKLNNKGINLCVGGGVNKDTILKYSQHANIKLIKKMETRKVILPTNMMFKKNALDTAIAFETNYIFYKKEIQDLKMNPEINRLTNLKTRK